MEFYVTFGGWAVGKLYTHTLPDADKNYKTALWLEYNPTLKTSERCITLIDLLFTFMSTVEIEKSIIDHFN